MRCPACAADNPKEAETCSGCGAKLKRPARRKNSGAGTFTFAPIPIPQNPCAVRAYRYALYGMIPVAGLFFGVPALVLGIRGYIRAKADPEFKGIGHATAGIVLGTLEILTNGVGLTFIGIGLTSLWTSG